MTPKTAFKPGRLFQVSLVAGAIATLVNLLVATVARSSLKVPKTFAPFTLAPLLLGSIVGALGSVSPLLLLLRFTRKPLYNFWTLSAILLIASFRLPLRLLSSKSPRFAGANTPVVLVLMLMHSIVAIASVDLLTRQVNRKQS